MKRIAIMKSASERAITSICSPYGPKPKDRGRGPMSTTTPPLTGLAGTD
ncbi:hypothetical protein PQ610_03310 [Tardisphaera miroshnichenkoae]